MSEALKIIDFPKKTKKKSPQKVLFFGRHQTFQLRTGWLKKGFTAVADNPYFFNFPVQSQFVFGELSHGAEKHDEIYQENSEKNPNPQKIWNQPEPAEDSAGQEYHCYQREYPNLKIQFLCVSFFKFQIFFGKVCHNQKRKKAYHNGQRHFGGFHPIERLQNKVNNEKAENG